MQTVRARMSPAGPPGGRAAAGVHGWVSSWNPVDSRVMTMLRTRAGKAARAAVGPRAGASTRLDSPELRLSEARWVRDMSVRSQSDGERINMRTGRRSVLPNGGEAL